MLSLFVNCAVFSDRVSAPQNKVWVPVASTEATARTILLRVLSSNLSMTTHLHPVGIRSQKNHCNASLLKSKASGRGGGRGHPDSHPSAVKPSVQRCTTPAGKSVVEEEQCSSSSAATRRGLVAAAV